jgi:hypothetical protein
MKTLKCKKCGVTVKDKTIIKHMWAAHRAHMMKNHTGGFSAKKKKPLADDRQEQRRDAVMSLIGPVGLHRNDASGDAHLRSTFVANGKKLTVIVHQGQNKIELANVTLVEMFE